MIQDDQDLALLLADPQRPVFLLGEVPPAVATPPGKCQAICSKFADRSRALATDGFIVYDIQDEPGRSDDAENKRPFPFRKLMDSSPYAALLRQTSGKPCLVYKCIADAQLEQWLDDASKKHSHTAINLVGRPSSQGDYPGPTLNEAMEMLVKTETDSAKNPSNNNSLKFGCVCIAERHTLEAAKSRGKEYPTEHLNMLRKQAAGASWFISQAVYDVEPTIRLLQDYASSCRQRGVTPRKVVLTFCPVSRQKTMNFIQWLGVRVPQDVQQRILEAENSVEESIQVCCAHLQQILTACAGIHVPLGISCESVSIFKAEIDGVHELFRRLQILLLNHEGNPWKVTWVQIDEPLFRRRQQQDNEEEAGDAKPNNNTSSRVDPVLAALGGAVLGGLLVGAGVILGDSKSGSNGKILMSGRSHS